MKILLSVAIVLCFFVSTLSQAQYYSVPLQILKELEHRSFEQNGKTYSYRIVYPLNYDKDKKYPVFMGLAGGLAFDRIVEYCYYTLFKSMIIKKDFITILPISFEEKTLKDFTDDETEQLIGIIKNNESVTDSNWIVAGTSYGGIAAFKFAREFPKLFDGIIAMPGGLPFDEFPEEWKEYRVMIAIGEREEEEWELNVEEAAKKLEGKVKTLIMFVMKDQTHNVIPSYDMDILYRKYFNY